MYTLAIVGATGMVGRQIIEVLEERKLPIKGLRLLASEKSVGEFVEFNDESLPVQQLAQDSFSDVDIALFCATDSISEEYCSIAVQAGAICIDTSSFWRMAEGVPLIVPSVNADALDDVRGKRIVASPSSSAVQLALTLKAVSVCSAPKRVIVSTYQPVSENGQLGVDELRKQSGELLNGRPAKNKVYPHQISFNCIPQVGRFTDDGSTVDEMSLVAETAKVLALQDLKMSVTAVRVPVFYGLSQSLNIETVEAVSVEDARRELEAMVDVELIDEICDEEYPMPVDVAGQDSVYVGRVRLDTSNPNTLNLWVAADNLRQGAATNVVQIAELLIQNHL